MYITYLSLIKARSTISLFFCSLWDHHISNDSSDDNPTLKISNPYKVRNTSPIHTPTDLNNQITFPQKQNSSTTIMKSSPNNDQPNLNTPNQSSKVNPQSMNECFLSTKQASSGSNKQIVLPPELEPLRMVIMSQHCALAPHIQELGNISLKFTTIIEKKKESSNKIFHNNFIPCSLRIKCDLTTTSAYENNPEFLSLKQELQETVRTFTKQGLLVMQKWSLINIKLLTNDRCHNILKKALSILDGLLLYWTEILEPKTLAITFQ
jgi:hypothetical protein